MILFINGAFGIGKTTLARRLRDRIPGSAIYDPELAGLALQRLTMLGGRRVEDFQSLHAWRRLTAAGISIMRRLRPNVIVPMAISDDAILREVLAAASRVDGDVRHYCLIAPVQVVHGRLAARGATAKENPWEYRRAAECCAAHAAPAFAVQVDAATRTPDELADVILAQ